ncbi:hypothetical protein ZWY2020_021049 [Hordeum vulgare]|nr:hypothetical protein ZWY2020_021049 [Hordeum vulgare]
MHCRKVAANQEPSFANPEAPSWDRLPLLLPASFPLTGSLPHAELCPLSLPQVPCPRLLRVGLLAPVAAAVGNGAATGSGGVGSFPIADWLHVARFFASPSSCASLLPACNAKLTRSCLPLHALSAWASRPLTAGSGAGAVARPHQFRRFAALLLPPFLSYALKLFLFVSCLTAAHVLERKLWPPELH